MENYLFSPTPASKCSLDDWKFFNRDMLYILLAIYKKYGEIRNRIKVLSDNWFKSIYFGLCFKTVPRLVILSLIFEQRSMYVSLQNNRTRSMRSSILN